MPTCVRAWVCVCMRAGLCLCVCASDVFLQADWHHLGADQQGEVCRDFLAEELHGGGGCLLREGCHGCEFHGVVILLLVQYVSCFMLFILLLVECCH